MLLLTALVTMPSPSSFLSDVGDWSSPFFDALLPIAVPVIGIFLAFAFIYFIVSAVKHHA